MKFIYFKKEDGTIVKRPKAISNGRKKGYLDSGWTKCDKDGKSLKEAKNKKVKE
jgi:hypothetical protein